MRIWDIINPWGALRNARRELIWLDGENGRLHERLVHTKRRAETAEKAAGEWRLLAATHAAEIDEYERLLASAHFRNPETGRLGRKGERFR